MQHKRYKKKVEIEARIYLLLGQWLFVRLGEHSIVFFKNVVYNFHERDTLMTPSSVLLTSQSVA